MVKNKSIPKVVDKTNEEIEQIFHSIAESSLADDEKEFVSNCINFATWFPAVLEKKNISIKRLQTLIFGKGYRNKNKNADEDLSDKNKDVDKENSNSALGDEASIQEEGISENPGENDTPPNTEPTSSDDDKKQKGHGRMAHTVYEDFTEYVLSPELQVGDLCPTKCGGRLYPFKPGIIVRVIGQNIADVRKYVVEKLRCALCNFLVSADIPAEIGDEKYDAKFKAWIVMQKYYVAVPFYRQEYFQRLIGFPLPDATQWDLVEKVANCCYPVFNYLKVLAAQGKRIFNDDTFLKILDVIKEIKADPSRERTGMYTTGIISEIDGHQIALFLNGTQHAGENLRDVLIHRSPKLGPILQMCDGSQVNIPAAMKTIICNCLSHAFRKFEELVDFFPDECINIMKMLSSVYDNDKETKDMSDKARLAYHQQHSQPVMENLKNYMAGLIDEHIIEPNSALGEAIHYMQKRWKKLTRFLTVAGAALDNNIVERALKVAIRNRKSAMFYKSCYSASVGGMLTSLIYTCYLAKENALDFLIALQQNKNEVMDAPHLWLPWNFKQTLRIKQQPEDITEGDANHLEHPPPADCLVAA